MNYLSTLVLMFGLLSCGNPMNGKGPLYYGTDLREIAPGDKVSFDTLQKTILNQNCLQCHSTEISTEKALQAWITPGSAEKSSLFNEVESGGMPLGKPALSTYQLSVIRAYIEQLVLVPAPIPTTPAPPTPPTSSIVTFEQIKTAVLTPYKCASCHAVSTEAKITRWISKTNPAKSLLYTRVHDGTMPKGSAKVPAAKQELLLQYVTDFAATH